MLFKALRLNLLEECSSKIIRWDKQIVPESTTDVYGLIYWTIVKSELNKLYSELSLLEIVETAHVTRSIIKVSIKYISDKLEMFMQKSSGLEYTILNIASTDACKHSCVLALSYLYTLLNVYENRELQNYRILTQLRAAPGSGKLYLSSHPVIRQYKEILNSHKDEFDYSVTPGEGINKNASIISYSKRG